jgi:hypothetical protein
MNESAIAIIRALLALRRAGAIAAVYCDAGVLRVMLNDGHVFSARKPERYHRVLFAVEQQIVTRKAAA